MRRPEFVARQSACQSACPSGLLGRLIGRVMARETAAVNEAAVELIELRPTDQVLEVGFGHGATIARVAAAVSGGLVAGVAPSQEMYRMAVRFNRRAIEAGRVELRRATAEALPYPDAAFDKVLAVHTVYFWASLAPPLREIARVLRRDAPRPRPGHDLLSRRTPLTSRRVTLCREARHARRRRQAPGAASWL